MLKKALRYIFRTILVAALYLATAKYGLLVPFAEGNTSPIWPPSGVGLAFLLLYGWELFPGVFIGAALATYSSDIALDASLSMGIGSTFESVAAYIIFNKLRGKIDLLRLHDVIALINASLLSPVFTASIGTVSLFVTGVVSQVQLAHTWTLLFTGHALGIIVVAPLLMTWLTPRKSKVTKRRLAEAFLGFVALIAVGVGSLLYYPDLKFLMLVALVWIGVRFSSRSVSLASFVGTALLIILTMMGYGPFVKYGVYLGTIFMQLFVGSMSLIALILTSVIAERQKTEIALLAAKETLEETVAKRTERLSKVNKKLKKEIQHRKAAEAKRDEFVGIVSHELKTPITAIKTYVQLLERKMVKTGDTKNTHFLSQITRQATRITTMITDLLDTSQIQAGRLSLEKSAVQMDSLIASLLMDFKHIDDTHTFVKSGEHVGRVVADEGRIGQVLTNLVTNAIKYSPEGSTITIHSVRKKGSVIINVIDEGVGIPKNKIDKIFDRFYRINKNNGRDTLSFGLGLYIAKEIIEEHGGKIWVESRRGRGTTFSFSLPLETGK